MGFYDKPLFEITLRKFEKEPEDLLRKFCMSLGLLQPGDSRDIIVDLLRLLLEAKKEHKLLSMEEITTALKEKRGASAPNLRRQLRRLMELGLVERISGKYRIKEFAEMSELIDNLVKFFVEPTIERIREYAKKLDSQFLD